MKSYFAFFLAVFATGILAFGADLSDPKSAAIAFADAMNHGDAAGVKAASTGSDELTAAAEALAKSVAANKKLSDAARDKFGEDSARKVTKPDYMPFVYPFDKPTLKVETDGDSAKLTVDNHPKPFLTLKLIDKDWRVELSGVTILTRDPGKLATLETMVAKVKSDLAEEIALGKYTTAEDAHKAYVDMLAKAEGKK